MKVVYPATIEKIDDSFWLEFPDLKGCQTWGSSVEETMSNAVEALEGYILSQLENGIKIVPASDIKNIEVSSDMIKTYIYCDIEVKSENLVKKTLTIPEWVNDLGLRQNINFSKVLTDAIIGKSIIG